MFLSSAQQRKWEEREQQALCDEKRISEVGDGGGIVVDLVHVEAESAEDALVERKAAFIGVVPLVCCFFIAAALTLVSGREAREQGREERETSVEKEKKRRQRPHAGRPRNCSPFPTLRAPQFPRPAPAQLRPYSQHAKNKVRQPGIEPGTSG